MLDDDIKKVEKLGKTLYEATDKGTRKSKWSDCEKQICQDAQNMIYEHVKGCQICQASFKSCEENMNISMTPPCTQFTTNLKIHISMCEFCNTANKKWNDDAIPVTNEIRERVAVLTRLRKMFHL